MSGKLTNSCLKTILQRVSVEVIFHDNPQSNWACCQKLTFKVMSMYFIFQNFSASSSINQTFCLSGKGGLNHKRQTEKQPSFKFFASPRTATCAFHKLGLSYAPHLIMSLCLVLELSFPCGKLLNISSRNS